MALHIFTRSVFFLVCLFSAFLATNTLLEARALDALKRADATFDFSKPVQQFEAPSLQTERARQSLRYGQPPPEYEIKLLKLSLAGNPAQPKAEALLAFAIISADETAVADFNDALARSFELCMLCDEDLVKWRIELVFAFWDRVSEDNRKAAFEGVDFARWWYLDADYLDTLEERAERSNIPYAAYRSAVDTPVRPEEIRPSAE